MSLLANVLPGNSPWTGGSLKRVSPPSGGLGSGIAGARNGAGSLLEGVAVSETKRARFNSGSNIRVPYARVVPVSDNKLPTTTGSTDGNKKDKVGETADLRPMEVAFIRGAGIAESNDLVEKGSDKALLPDNGDESASYGGAYKGLHGAMLRVGHGVDRPQRLCTFEYARRFFEVSLGNASFQAPAGLQAGTDAFLHSTGAAADRKDVMSKLHNEMRNAGVFLWSPDGVVVGKDHTGSEPDWEDIFDTKHGQLFNVAVQGPAVVSTFTGDRKLVSMPGERLFVLVTCDVIEEQPGNENFNDKKASLDKKLPFSASYLQTSNEKPVDERYLPDQVTPAEGERVRTVASNSAKLAKTRHESVVTNTHAWDTWAGSEWSVHKRAAKECSPRYHRMAMSTRGRVTAAVRRGSPSLRAPFRSYRRTLSGARRSLLGNPSGCRGGRLLPETLLGAGTDAPSETLLGAEGEGVTLSS